MRERRRRRRETGGRSDLKTGGATSRDVYAPPDFVATRRHNGRAQGQDTRGDRGGRDANTLQRTHSTPTGESQTSLRETVTQTSGGQGSRKSVWSGR